MTIDYSELLTNDQKRNILQQRIAQFAAEAYQHTLNKKSLEALNDEAGIEASDKSLQILESAIQVHKAELEALPAGE